MINDQIQKQTTSFSMKRRRYVTSIPHSTSHRSLHSALRTCGRTARQPVLYSCHGDAPAVGPANPAHCPVSSPTANRSRTGFARNKAQFCRLWFRFNCCKTHLPTAQRSLQQLHYSSLYIVLSHQDVGYNRPTRRPTS